MSALDLTKKFAPMVAGFGASSIVAAIVKNNVTYTGKLAKLDRVAVPVATFFIGSAVSDLVRDSSNRQIDELAKNCQTFADAVRGVKTKVSDNVEDAKKHAPRQ